MSSTNLKIDKNLIEKTILINKVYMKKTNKFSFASRKLKEYYSQWFLEGGGEQMFLEYMDNVAEIPIERRYNKVLKSLQYKIF